MVSRHYAKSVGTVAALLQAEAWFGRMSMNMTTRNAKLTAITKSGKEVYYAIECKDRKMSHTKYQDSGYIIEDHKMKELMKAANKGYRPLYLNSFNDGYIIIWNINKIDLNECGETGEKRFHRTTVKKSNNDLYSKNKITLKNKQAEWIGRII